MTGQHDGLTPRGGDVVSRHRVSTRLWHWTNALALLVMLMSGLMIFNAHPRLYWGSYGANFDRPWFVSDRFGVDAYYESIDLVDAMHPQPILAHTMNDWPLPIVHGAPIRLRVERQLGYKQAKYVMRIEARNTFDGVGLGRGGYWEDHAPYDRYAGI